MRFRILRIALVAALAIGAARTASASDLLDCLKGATIPFKHALNDLNSLGDFVVNNTSCTGYLTEPEVNVFGPLTAALKVARSQGLFSDANGCMTAATRPIAKILVGALGSVAPGAKSRLQEIADAKVTANIESVPVIGKYMKCGCALANEKFAIEDIKGMYSEVSKTADSCVNTIEAAYDAVVDAVSSVGSAIGSIFGGGGGHNTTPTEFYAKFYAPGVAPLMSGGEPAIAGFLASVRGTCDFFWNMHGGSTPCAGFEAKFRDELRFAHEALFAAKFDQAQQVGLDFAKIQYQVYKQQCTDKQCTAGVFWLAFAMVGDFKSAMGASKYEDPDDPHNVDLLQSLKYSLPAKYKPKFIAMVNEGKARATKALTTHQTAVSTAGVKAYVAKKVIYSLINKHKLDIAEVRRRIAAEKRGTRAVAGTGLLVIKAAKPQAAPLLFKAVH